MRLVSVISMAALAGLASGCSQPERKDSTDPQAIPRCELADTTARTCVKRGNKNVCTLYVGEMGGKTYVFPGTLIVPLPERDSVIVWQLEVPGASFTRGSDGPIWKGGSGSEFEDGGPTDDADGNPENKPAAKRYRIKFKNSAGGGGSHDYAIKYRNSQGQVKQCDPRIVSQAG
jgi:hypothetical protein